VSPRGVAIPDRRHRLFEAAARILERDGPAGLTSRAITTEAGTSAGLLFRHFPDFDAFLAEFVADRLGHVHTLARSWAGRAGTGTVADNLTESALSLLPIATRLFEVVHSRPALISRLLATHLERGGAWMEEIERAFAAYLDAEVALGRVRPDADTGAVALALAASVHELSLRHAPNAADLPQRIRRVATALADQISASPPSSGPE
jgi:AcrR family transcriptional regulator